MEEAEGRDIILHQVKQRLHFVKQIISPLAYGFLLYRQGCRCSPPRLFTLKYIVMKKISNKFLAVTILLAFCVTLFAFSSKWGGEVFEIYLNNKLVLQQYGTQMNSVKSLPLDLRSSNDQLSVKYYHCGRVGKNRDIAIKDGQNNVLKEWRFNDGEGTNAAMNCPVKDILSLGKNNSDTRFNLYYSSSELPKGRLLASFVVATENKSKAMTR